MTNSKKQTVVVKLSRSGRDEPWGIRIVGGADLGTPIIVTRVSVKEVRESLEDLVALDIPVVLQSENEDLLKGDVIKKIDDYDARDVRHVDAQHLLQKSESVKLVVERTRAPQATKILPKSPVPRPIVEEETARYSPEVFNLPHEHMDEVRAERNYLYQPYRTTPLVLPGAKVKKDAPIGECYLRHHPNPMIRASPHHYDTPLPEVAMKQKVAETVLQRVLGPNDVPKVVHKQFNSPIGLYSEQNIADTIKCQTSAVPLRRGPVKYDPSKSEAYKALQEEALGDVVQEVRQPVRTGVFSPHKANQSKVHQPISKSSSAAYVNSLNDSAETIHQSGSFKRIMYSVLGQTDY